MASARMTLGTIFGTVSDTAVAVSTTLGAVTQGVEMLDNYVKEAVYKQQQRSIAEMSSFNEKLMEELAQEDTVRQIAVQEFMGKSNKHRELYMANYNRLGRVLAASKNEKWEDVADEAHTPLKSVAA
ncbi:hypothetical protein [Caballeronia sp. LZ034LL]|uniref:hypothetical protein n=1 Tax=Caballeronia sp. LZ034LL TaxID=3038567 RepID=UPI002865D89E|nr:hypothetical protein [Caballeronia sp. LZ034LL]MDR5839337.1 hypothetical protein [Caballeronia sp. LZ034LL]